MGDSRSPPWVIRPRHEFTYFEDASLLGEDDIFASRLLMIAGSNGATSDTFRLQIFGSGSIRGSFSSDEIFSNSTLQGFHFSFEFRADEIDLQTNSCSSKWTSVIDLIENEVLQISRGQNKHCQQEFRELLNLNAAEKGSEASIRWSLLASSSDKMRLSLEALPRQAGFLRKSSHFREDTCPTIELAAFRLDCDMIRSGPLTGPRPILFSSNVEATEAEAASSPHRLQKNIQGILRLIPEAEHIHLPEAEAFCQHPTERVKIFPFGADDLPSQKPISSHEKGSEFFR